MTVLDNAIRIDASPERVWATLAKLDVLHEYDPVVAKSEALPGPRDGLGASRQCDLKAGGWFRERVTAWVPQRALSFELFDCTLPVRRLTHSYTLTPEAGGTLVEQRMEYELKFGPIGMLMDTLMVRRKSDAGIKGFFQGLKRYVETGGARKGGR